MKHFGGAVRCGAGGGAGCDELGSIIFFIFSALSPTCKTSRVQQSFVHAFRVVLKIRLKPLSLSPVVYKDVRTFSKMYHIYVAVCWVIQSCCQQCSAHQRQFMCWMSIDRPREARRRDTTTESPTRRAVKYESRCLHLCMLQSICASKSWAALMYSQVQHIDCSFRDLLTPPVYTEAGMAAPERPDALTRG